MTLLHNQAGDSWIRHCIYDDQFSVFYHETKTTINDKLYYLISCMTFSVSIQFKKLAFYICNPFFSFMAQLQLNKDPIIITISTSLWFHFPMPTVNIRQFPLTNSTYNYSTVLLDRLAPEIVQHNILLSKESEHTRAGRERDNTISLSQGFDTRKRNNINGRWQSAKFAAN